MLACKQNAAAREIKHARRRRSISGALASVKGLRGRKINGAPAEFARAHGEIHVLEVDEEALVKAAKSLKHGAAHEEKRTHHLVDGACVVMRPIRREVR